MKTVVGNLNNTTVSLDNLNESKIYVLYEKRSKRYGLVHNRCGHFVASVLNSTFTIGNAWSGRGQGDHTTLKSFMETMMNLSDSHDFYFYEFDTMKEALRFLADRM